MVTAGPRFGPVVPQPSGHAEQRWAVEHRTPTLDTVTHIGSLTADTIVALAATVGELLIFLVITATAHRARPAVPQLDQPGAPTSGFPSGHTGAAIALYGYLAVILLRNVTPRWVAVSLAMLGSLIPIVVAVSYT